MCMKDSVSLDSPKEFIIDTYQIEAIEPESNLKHIWQGFELLKAQNIALNLSHAGWRDIKIVKDV